MSKKLSHEDHFAIRVRKAVRSKVTEVEVRQICEALTQYDDLRGTKLKEKFLTLINYGQ